MESLGWCPRLADRPSVPRTDGHTPARVPLQPARGRATTNLENNRKHHVEESSQHLVPLPWVRIVTTLVDLALDCVTATDTVPTNDLPREVKCLCYTTKREKLKNPFSLCSDSILIET